MRNVSHCEKSKQILVLFPKENERKDKHAISAMNTLAFFSINNSIRD